MSKELTKPKIVPKLDLKEPSLYKVIYINDDVTPMDFVIQSLIDVFDYSPETAHDITMAVHNDGSGVAAILPYEMAEQKGVEVTQLARANGFPLVVKLEPDA